MNAKIAAAVGAVGLVTIGLIGTTSITKVPREAEVFTIEGNDIYRTAASVNDCPIEGEGGYAYLVDNCQSWYNHDGHCVCITLKTEQLANEVLVENISSTYKRKCGIVRYTLGGVLYHVEGCFKLAWTPPAGATGINARVLKDEFDVVKEYLITTVMANVPTRLTEDLSEVCAPCTVTPQSWGHCPRCWLYQNCATVCGE